MSFADMKCFEKSTLPCGIFGKIAIYFMPKYVNSNRVTFVFFETYAEKNLASFNSFNTSLKRH